jgi:hypothetical protein
MNGAPADFDLRNRSLAGDVCAEKIKGTSDNLVERCELSDVFTNPGIERLVSLPGNKPLINSSEDLSSPRMVRSVEELNALDLLHQVDILGTALHESVDNVDAPGYGIYARAR